MANSRSDTKGKRNVGSDSTTDRIEVPFNKRRFVQLKLSDAQKAEVKDFIESGDLDRSYADHFSHEGYSCSWKDVDDGRTIQVSVACIYTDHPNAGLILTGRGRTFETALAVCAYKDKYCCEDGIWSTGEDYNPSDPDGIE